MTRYVGSRGGGESEIAKILTLSRIVVYILYAWTIFGAIVLGLRVFLLAFSANTETRFVTFIYETSDSYMAPFRAIFPGREVGSTGYLDISAVFAIVIYILFALSFSSLIRYVQFKIDSYEKNNTDSREYMGGGKK